MCGNGIRCLARFVADQQNQQQRACPDTLTIETVAGLMRTTLQDWGQVTAGICLYAIAQSCHNTVHRWRCGIDDADPRISAQWLAGILHCLAMIPQPLLCYRGHYVIWHEAS
ncbi:MAG: hypothetical protein OXI08_01730 [Cyanobacteria bacterium MAG IRC4_bin_6]|nr:hypothetical protein [Cyanobacteria bacterium MAG IRC3_bin_20]MDE0646784.1 hypothetical protein [Cyanobacteria bacterium MAG IRC4_bin_6]